MFCVFFPRQHKNWYVILLGHYLAATLFGRSSVWRHTSFLPSGYTLPCVCVCVCARASRTAAGAHLSTKQHIQTHTQSCTVCRTHFLASNALLGAFHTGWVLVVLLCYILIVDLGKHAPDGRLRTLQRATLCLAP